MDHIIGFGVHGISNTIAITSEMIAGRKGRESSAARNTAQNAERGNVEGATDEDLTEHAWEPDEAGNGISLSSNEHNTSTEWEDGWNAQPEELLEPTEETFIIRPLPMAVILPQRRPKNRQRGFIRAYAPILGEYSGISQRMFLDFLNSWDKASETSPVFDVINLACFGVSMVPNGIATAVSISVGVAAGVAKEVQGRYRSNKYLDKINEDLFKPRGLVAMVMTYKPDLPDDLFLRADTSNPTNTALTKVLTMQNKSKLRQMLFRLRDTSGTAQGDSQVPDCAPLTYPSLDLALTPNTLTKTNILAKNRAVVQDYLDRRAQASFITANPTCKIAAALPPPQQPFVNRYCDPNHRVNNGSVFGLLTGGTVDPIGFGRVVKAKHEARKNGEERLTEREIHDAHMGRRVRGRITGTPSKDFPVVGKLFKKNVLYLVIVNLPSSEDVRHVEESLM